jgi:transcriptional regulator with XRE-family HTH domain
MTPGEMIRAILKRPEWTQAKLAEHFGVTQPTVHRWVKGAEPEGKHWDAIRALHGLPAQAAFGNAVQRRSRQTTVPDLAIFAGMGGGGLLEVAVDDAGVPTDPDQVRGYWEFPDYMLRRFGDLKNIYAWEVRGDSMEPTLSGGAVVFVDTGQTKLPPDDIYAINYGDGLMVKRLKLVPRSDMVSVISDNDRYGSDQLIRDDVKVWGRVIGWFQWRG